MFSFDQLSRIFPQISPQAFEEQAVTEPSGHPAAPSAVAASLSDAAQARQRALRSHQQRNDRSRGDGKTLTYSRPCPA